MERKPQSVEASYRIRTGEQGAAAHPARPDEPFRLLLVGDFSGRGARGDAGSALAGRPRRIDRDDWEAVLARLEPRVRATLPGGATLELAPRSLDDLHPDALWERLEVFAELRSLRRRLSNPETFAAAAAELGRSSAASPASADRPAGGPAPAPPSSAPPGAALEAALSATEDADGSRRGSELVDAILAELVVPRVPATPGQDALVRSVDDAAAETMRALLRSPELRRLEASWRALDFLVRRVETDARLQLWVFDVPTAELVGDLAAHEDPRASATWRALFEPDAAEADDGAARWAAWTSLELSFGAQPASLALLARIGRLAAAAGAPFLAAAHESLAGCASFAERPDPDDWTALAPAAAAAWSAVRTGDAARWLLLALPRLLLRSPYGARTSPLERFAFQELAARPDHEGYLWGSGAVAPTLALARAFTERGWELSPLFVAEADRLPVPVHEDADGEAAIQPAAEVVLTDRAREHLETAGLVPLVSVRDTDRVRVGPLRSIAGEPLAGGWVG